MSKYTTELRFICETSAGYDESKGYSDVKTILQTAAPKIFNFDYPIFDEDYRLPLEIKILRHYYTREISEETVGLWRLRLEDKMNMIMPLYNQLYKSELIKFNPMYDVDLIRDHKTENNGESNNTSNRVLHSDNQQTSTGTRDDTTHGVTTGSTNTTTDNRINGTIDTTTNNTSNGNVDVTNESKAQGTVDTTNQNTNNGTIDVTNSGNTSEESKTNKSGSGWQLYSDTPQGGIEGINVSLDEGDLGKMLYLTNATKTTNTENTTSSGKGETHGTSKQTNNDSSNGVSNVVSVDASNEASKTTRTDTQEGTTNVVNSEESNGKSRANSTEDTQGTLNSQSNVNTNGQIDTNEGITGKNTITSTEDYLEHVRGKQGASSYSRLLNEFRETFLNIDKMLIEELNDLFFGLW